MTGIRHKHFQDLGFDGDNVLGYKLGPVQAFIYEDDDCLDWFRVSFAGIDIGWMRTKEELAELVNTDLSLAPRSITEHWLP